MPLSCEESCAPEPPRRRADPGRGRALAGEVRHGRAPARARHAAEIRGEVFLKLTDTLWGCSEDVLHAYLPVAPGEGRRERALRRREGLQDPDAPRAQHLARRGPPVVASVPRKPDGRRQIRNDC